MAAAFGPDRRSEARRMTAVASLALDDPALVRLITERTRAAGVRSIGACACSSPAGWPCTPIYAFCREVDDIADGDAPGCSSPAEKLAALDRWRAEIDAVYAGRPTQPLGRALIGPVGDFALPREDFVAVIDGCAMDAELRMRRPSLAVLDLYCDRVACAVGRLSVRIFGEFRTPWPGGGAALGRALQLTNILRDLREDAGLGRLYLPDELLTKHGIDGDLPDTVDRQPRL